MNEIEIAKLIISQDGSCDDASCENCPAEKVRQKLDLYSCNDIWDGDKDEYCKKWFEDWLKEQEENIMADKRVIFESEEELLKFINDCIYGKNTEQTIRLAKQLGYIRKNPVEEAEERFNKWMSEIGTGRDKSLIFSLYEAIQYLKERQK